MGQRFRRAWAVVVRASTVLAVTASLASCGGIDEAELNARAADLDRRIDGVLTEVRALATQIEGVTTGVTDIRRFVEEVGDRIGDIGAPVGEELASIMERAEAFALLVEERLAEIDARFDEVTEAVVANVATTPIFDDMSSEMPTGERVMVIESIEALPSDESKFREAASLRSEAKAIKGRVPGLEAKRRELMRNEYPYWWWSAEIERRRAWELERRRAREAIQTEISQLNTEARRLETRANALEREGGMVRQRITGWDGSTTVVLETSRDLSAVVSRAQNDGSALAWRGQLVERDGSREVWRVTGLMPRPRPAELNRSR